MKLRNLETAYTYDDLAVVPQKSDIQSRDECDPQSYLGDYEMQVPILGANMDTVTGVRMAEELYKLGALGFTYRGVFSEHGVPSIGLKDHDGFRSFEDMVCLDVAHGHQTQVLRKVKELTKDGFKVVAGNVCTPQAALELRDAGAVGVKVGIGPGAVCTTRIQTGCGVPQASAVCSVAEAVGGTMTVIADGGIRQAGDIVKALALGADLVMVGSLLAGTHESPGDTYFDSSTGRNVKSYRGMASREVKRAGGLDVSYVEGTKISVPAKGAVKHVIKNLVDGIKSGMSYVGARNLAELRERAVFRVVTNNGMREATPHGV